MSVFIKLGAHKEGIHDIESVRADSLRDAIKKMKLHPYTYPDDWVEYDVETDVETITATSEEALDQIVNFYGSDDDRNAVDGDSSSEWVILEVRDTEIITHGPTHYGRSGCYTIDE